MLWGGQIEIFNSVINCLSRSAVLLVSALMKGILNE
jgi:hypothetical protein